MLQWGEVMGDSSYFLGVDGGGSKTTAVVADEFGNIAAAEVGGSIKFYSNEMSQTRNNMSAILSSIKEKTGIACFKSAFIGMSALNGRASADELEAFTGGVISADMVCMDSDLHIALETHLTDGACAVAISGTGSMVAARDSGGIVRHAGGWGYILGDEGSGYRMSLDAIRAGIRGGEGSARPTALTGAVLSFYKADCFDDLISIFYDPPISRQDIASFLPKVRKCAENGDETAAEIITNGADDLARTAAALLKDYPDDIPVGLWGGAFQHIPLFLSRFTSALAQKNIAKVFLLEYPPEIGAVFAAYRLCGVKVCETIKSNIKRGINKHDAIKLTKKYDGC